MNSRRENKAEERAYESLVEQIYMVIVTILIIVSFFVAMYMVIYVQESVIDLDSKMPIIILSWMIIILINVILIGVMGLFIDPLNKIGLTPKEKITYKYYSNKRKRDVEIANEGFW